MAFKEDRRFSHFSGEGRQATGRFPKICRVVQLLGFSRPSSGCGRSNSPSAEGAYGNFPLATCRRFAKKPSSPLFPGIDILAIVNGGPCPATGGESNSALPESGGNLRKLPYPMPREGKAAVMEAWKGFLRPGGEKNCPLGIQGRQIPGAHSKREPGDGEGKVAAARKTGPRAGKWGSGRAGWSFNVHQRPRGGTPKIWTGVWAGLGLGALFRAEIRWDASAGAVAGKGFDLKFSLNKI